jgi:hypothetical protein
MPCRIPHRHHERHDAKTPIPSSTHRAPGANQLGFMAEVFVDEMTQQDEPALRAGRTKGGRPITQKMTNRPLIVFRQIAAVIWRTAARAGMGTQGLRRRFFL